MESKRSFKVVSVDTSNRAKGVQSEGRYISSTPAGAARKAGSQYCRESAIRGQCTLFVTVQETTRGSNNKVYSYKIKRTVVNNKVNHEGKIVNHKYEVVAKAL